MASKCPWGVQEGHGRVEGSDRVHQMVLYLDGGLSRGSLSRRISAFQVRIIGTRHRSPGGICTSVRLGIGALSRPHEKPLFAPMTQSQRRLPPVVANEHFLKMGQDVELTPH